MEPKAMASIVVGVGNTTLLSPSPESVRVTVAVRVSVDVVYSCSDAAHWLLMPGGHCAATCLVVVSTVAVWISSESCLFFRVLAVMTGAVVVAGD